MFASGFVVVSPFKFAIHALISRAGKGSEKVSVLNRPVVESARSKVLLPSRAAPVDIVGVASKIIVTRAFASRSVRVSTADQIFLQFAVQTSMRLLVNEKIRDDFVAVDFARSPDLFHATAEPRFLLYVSPPKNGIAFVTNAFMSLFTVMSVLPAAALIKLFN